MIHSTPEDRRAAAQVPATAPSQPLAHEVLEAAAQIQAAWFGGHSLAVQYVRQLVSEAPNQARQIVAEAARQIDSLRAKGLIRE